VALPPPKKNTASTRVTRCQVQMAMKYKKQAKKKVKRKQGKYQNGRNSQSIKVEVSE